MRMELRPATPDDQPLIDSLISRAVLDELGASSWPPEVRDQVVSLQVFGRGHTAPAGPIDSFVIIADGRPVGWILTETFEDGLLVRELVVSPENRRRGIGEATMRLFLRATPVRLHVNSSNVAAIRFYERLGFRRVNATEGELPPQYLMIWQPALESW
jgi:ribosomal protein S18 acetylase RimI-like enzyme